VFFDLEGFPLAERVTASPKQRTRLAEFVVEEGGAAADEAERGREYLWGAATRRGAIVKGGAAPERVAGRALPRGVVEGAAHGGLVGGAAQGGMVRSRSPERMVGSISPEGVVGLAAPKGRERDAFFDRDDEFVAWWAHTPEQEKRALEGFVDWVTALRRADPTMHIYHYGAYEVSALRRLSMRHATREEEVDALLRSNVLIDLYEVVRGALLLGTDNYSIKSVEKLYWNTEGGSGWGANTEGSSGRGVNTEGGSGRGANTVGGSLRGANTEGGDSQGTNTEGGRGRSTKASGRSTKASGRGTVVAKGDESVVVYDAWLENPDGEDTSSSAVLASLLEYNRDDCISTRQLADFLWELRCKEPKAAKHAPSVEDWDSTAESEPVSERAAAAADRTAEENLEVAHLQQRLSAAGPWHEGSALASEGVREGNLLSQVQQRFSESGPWLEGSPPRERERRGGLGSAEGGGERAYAWPENSPPANEAVREGSPLTNEGVRDGQPLVNTWPEGSPLANEGVRETLSALLLFHKREAKPGWWRRFDWLSAPPEALVEDDRTLGLLSRTETQPFKSSPRKRRLVYEYRSQSTQDCKIEAGAAVVLRSHATQAGSSTSLDAPGLGLSATLVSKNRRAGIYQLECGEDPPALLSMLPNEFVDPTPIPAAIRAVVRQLCAAPDRPSALSRFLLRRPPVPVQPRPSVPDLAVLDLAAKRPFNERETAMSQQTLEPLQQRPAPDFAMLTSAQPASAEQGLPDSSERETAEWISAAALQLDADYLCIQGPPGTGKTFVGSHAAAALIQAGRRVGVLAHSHAAVNNLLAKTIEVLSVNGGSVNGGAVNGGAVNDGAVNGRSMNGASVNGGSVNGASTRALKIGGDKADVERMRALCGDGVSVEHIASASGLAKAPLEEDVLLIGATTWAYANDVLQGQLDTLFVDEAGQLPLANLVAASRSSRNLILLGDQMQLPAPCEGAHPAGSGQSCLDYLLRGAPTVPPELGIFLSRSYRLHPLLCSVVSELVYSGRLLAHPSTASRSLALAQRPPPADDATLPPLLSSLSLAERPAADYADHPPLLSRGAGIQVIPVHHSSNTHASPEEASTIATLFSELLRSDLLVGTAPPRPLAIDDILIVAPYNAQVGLIRSLLPRGARVGTVDRFQGQEAPVVLLSLCHSSFAAPTAGADQVCVSRPLRIPTLSPLEKEGCPACPSTCNAAQSLPLELCGTHIGGRPGMCKPHPPYSHSVSLGRGGLPCLPFHQWCG
jgi:hypothetical protein